MMIVLSTEAILLPISHPTNIAIPAVASHNLTENIAGQSPMEQPFIDLFANTIIQAAIAFFLTFAKVSDIIQSPIPEINLRQPFKFIIDKVSFQVLGKFELY